jgi:hypothetical protein
VDLSCLHFYQLIVLGVMATHALTELSPCAPIFNVDFLKAFQFFVFQYLLSTEQT